MPIKWDRDSKAVKDKLANAYGFDMSVLDSLSTSLTTGTVLTLAPHRKLELQATREATRNSLLNQVPSINRTAAPDDAH